MRGVVTLVAAMLLVLVLGCGFYAGAVGARALPAPAFNLRFGGYRLISFTTNTASCAERMLCPVGHIRTRTRSYYAVWLMHHAGATRAPGAPFSSGQALLVLRLRDGGSPMFTL